MTNNQSNILVSVCCLSYNHEPFIRKALDGFLMQQPPSCVPQGAKMSDWCEILIHDDCSTDGTDEIIKEYATQYPDLIFPLYETENQYSRGGKGHMDMFNYNRARGKYIAYCEGDDYWTDPHKLQKQVDFMEVHQDYSICMHGYNVDDVRNGKHYESQDFATYSKASNKNADGIDFTVRDYLAGHYGQPLTMLFRLSMFDFAWCTQYQYYRDTHEIYHLLKAGKGYWMNFDGGVYHKHNGGISSSVSIDKSIWEEREHILELYLKTKDNDLKEYLISVLLWNHDVYCRERRVGMFHSMMLKFWYQVPLISLNTYIKILKRHYKQISRK